MEVGKENASGQKPEAPSANPNEQPAKHSLNGGGNKENPDPSLKANGHAAPAPQEVERFAALLAGHGCASGTHGIPTWDEAKGKWSIKSTARTLKEGGTLAHYAAHLAGKTPLGIVPIRADSTCLFGCGDIDDYDIDAIALITEIERLKFPLVPCRSKSGGLHLFLFLREPEPAAAVQACLREMMAALGHPRAEIFPKQVALVHDRDQGNWMVMPYFGDDFSGKLPNGGKLHMQYGLKRAGGEMTLGEFLRAAEAARTATAEIKVKKPRAKSNGADQDATEAKHAAAKCAEYAAELAELTANGNTALNKYGFIMGQMIARGWISREAVEQAFLAAIISWTDQEHHRDTLKRALDDGMQEPHADLGTDESGLPVFSEIALAARFAEQHSGDLRYVAEWGQWMSWTGTHWKHDSTLHAFDLARHLCREVAPGFKNAHVIASAKTVAAVERLAKADRRLAATSDQWDADPWLLNTPDGTVDLKTGKCRPCKPEDFITKITAVAMGDPAACPMWDAVLRRATGENAELERYIQRMLGYGQTGVTTEEAMFFLFGTGANSKGVITKTVAGIMGDYHDTAPMETLTASQFDQHPTDLAGLRGARLVTATETEEGRRWAESRIKLLTGGDPVKARLMRQDFFTYTPQFKLVISGNHKPGLRSVNEAIRRRMNLLPFTVTIPPEERDQGLKEKLKTEWPAILGWMVKGCLDWQERGLDPPKAVTQATDEYLESEDAMGAWIEECCDRDEKAWTKTTPLFQSWKGWAEAAEEFVGSTKRFKNAMESRGFKPDKRHGERGYCGLTLREAGTAAAVPSIKLVVWVSREKDLAILVQAPNGSDVWLPKSQITMVEREDGQTEVTLPAWLAEEKRLLAGDGQGRLPLDGAGGDPTGGKV
jgi:putative DNA primase/helicase